MNFKTNQICCVDIDLLHPISIWNPANSTFYSFERVESSIARRTLSIILSPDGKGNTQIQHCLGIARDFLKKKKIVQCPKR